MYSAIRPFLFQDHLQKENTFVISLLTGKKNLFSPVEQFFNTLSHDIG